MKIGLVLDDTLDTPDGVQQYVLGIGGWLTDQGHEVHYLVGNTQRKDVPNVHSLSNNLRVKFNGNRMSMPLPVSRRRLKVFLEEMQYDVIHVQVPYSPFLAGRVIQSVPSHTAVVGTFHILPYSALVTFSNRMLGLLNRHSGKRFDRMVAVSPPARDFAKAIYGYQPTIIPNPVRIKQFADVMSSSSDLNIVFLGRLVARKGSLQLLKAVAHVKEGHLFDDDFKVYIGGKGELLDELKAFVHAHKLEEIVSFAGFVNEEDKPAFLAKADLAVYPSTGGESFGIVLLEAMASIRGTVLGGNNPGYASVLGPMPDQLFNPDDIPVFAQKLAWYLSHPETRARSNEFQREYVEKFDINVVGAQLVTIYKQALQSRPKS